MFKQYKKDMIDMTKIGIIAPIGASIITKAGGDASPINTMTGFMPMMATMSGAKGMLKSLKGFGK